jgi:ubiquinone/menaquinone biosynthesis C-methylase UbiE
MSNHYRWLEIAAHQRRYFNSLADVFDVPQPAAVMDRLGQIVAAAELHPGNVAQDVGTGTGVLIPLIESYQPSIVLACDVAEQMLARVHHRYRRVLAFQCDVVSLALNAGSVDVVFMNAMYGNIQIKPRPVPKFQMF